MKDTPPATDTAATSKKSVRLYQVHRSIQFKGTRYSGGREVALTDEDLGRDDVKAWLEHGWVTDPRANAAASPTAKAIGREQYEVLQQIAWHGVTRVPGDLIDFAAKGSHSNRDRWLAAGKIRKVGEPAPVQATVAAPMIPPGAVGTSLREIAVLSLDPSPHNPRKNFDEAKLRELAESIRAQGIIEPLIVRPADGKDRGRFEIVAGERRYRAAKLAGVATVPCLVRNLDRAAAALVQGIENLQRADLDAMEECEGYELLMREAKLTVPQIAQQTGRSEASVYARLKLQECPPGIKEALRKGIIPASTAELVARLAPEHRPAAMDAILYAPPNEGEEADKTAGGRAGSVLSFRQAKAWIERHRTRLEQEAAWLKTASASKAVEVGGVKVLSVDESREALIGANYVRNSQDYVKPTDRCWDDPERRTFEQIAQAADRALPAAVIARSPLDGEPVVLLPRKATEQILADQIPSAEEQERRRKEADAKRRTDAEAADRRRKDHEAQMRTRAAALVCHVRLGLTYKTPVEDLLRLTVTALFEAELVDQDGVVEALRDMGVPVEDSEADTVSAPEWVEEYLRSCDLPTLHAWLVWFAVHDFAGYGQDIEESRLASAEALVGLREPSPQTSAVAATAEEDNQPVL